MISVEELTKRQEEIENKIYDYAMTAELVGDDIDAMPDGVVNPEKYLSAYPKVAWVGKEAYDEDGGGWSLAKGFINKTDWSTLTWQRVIKVMYSLRNNIPYNQLKDIKENPDMGDVMQSIAWINLSKMPGGKSSSDRKYIKKYREHWRTIVLEQISIYSPDVIIFCNTLDACCFFDFFPNGKQPDGHVYYTDKNGQKKRFIDIFKKGGTILLDVFHPARTMSHEMEELYVDKLVETINKYCHE